MVMIDDKELAQLFKVESTEHLARLDDGLLRLEKTPGDQPLLEEVFRESHNLKGAARMLGLSKIEAAAHGLETILNTARKGARRVQDSFQTMCGSLDFGQPQHARRTLQVVGFAEHFFQQRLVAGCFLQTQQTVVKTREMLRAFHLEKLSQFLVVNH